MSPHPRKMTSHWHCHLRLRGKIFTKKQRGELRRSHGFALETAVSSAFVYVYNTLILIYVIYANEESCITKSPLSGDTYKYGDQLIVTLKLTYDAFIHMKILRCILFAQFLGLFRSCLPHRVHFVCGNAW